MLQADSGLNTQSCSRRKLDSAEDLDDPGRGSSEPHLIPPQLICPCHWHVRTRPPSLHPADGGPWVVCSPQFVENEYTSWGPCLPSPCKAGRLGTRLNV